MTTIEKSPQGDWPDRVAEYDLLEKIWATPVDARPDSLAGWTWENKRHRFWIVLAAIVSVVVVVTVLALTGLLGSWYEWFWKQTLGEPYTHWFRRNPWFFVPAVLVVVGGLFLIVRRERWRALIVTSCWFGAGFLFGHVIW